MLLKTQLEISIFKREQIDYLFFQKLILQIMSCYKISSVVIKLKTLENIYLKVIENRLLIKKLVEKLIENKNCANQIELFS